MLKFHTYIDRVSYGFKLDVRAWKPIVFSNTWSNDPFDET